MVICWLYLEFLLRNLRQQRYLIRAIGREVSVRKQILLVVVRVHCLLCQPFTLLLYLSEVCQLLLGCRVYMLAKRPKFLDLFNLGSYFIKHTV